MAQQKNLDKYLQYRIITILNLEKNIETYFPFPHPG